MFADVLIEYGAKAIDQTFTYIIPTSLSDLKKGMKVKVPFGKQIVNGFVVNIKDECDSNNLKEIIEITSYDLILSDELLELGKYIKETTLCSLIQSYQVMLPSSMKVKNIKSNYEKYNEYLIINNNPEEYINNHSKAKKQIELLKRLQNNDVILKSDYDNTIVKKLLDLGLISIKKEVKYRINNKVINKNNIKLTDEQIKAINIISDSFGSSNTFLIHGVTGSGKTEIYMNLIDKVILNGKCAVMLVPEISLTAQMANRFYDHFGDNVAILHSALSEGEKYDEYHKIMNGDVHVVVGTRSAIFAPFKDLGIIIIDEEHSTNYKQDNNPRYNAKDIAIKRSEYFNCPVVLGSATPSLESMARGYKNVYKLIELKNRIGSSKLPEVILVDMSNEYRKRNMIISDLLDENIKEVLKNKNQAMIFLNRRGFSTIISCKNCGYIFKCPHCDITLTYHKSSNNLRCHYCGYTLLGTDICPECHEKSLTNYGLGTEKLEEELRLRYPSSRIVRMDADTTRFKGSHEKIIKMIENEEVDIIVGTQMISKGLDFPKITLVGVINADESLNIPDFRSSENTFSLLNQVAGRAGRSNLNGKVIIQTFDDNNKTLNFVKNNDYTGEFNYEMQIRKVLKYPPYYYLTSIKIVSKEYDLSKIEANKCVNYLKKKLSNVIILGPTTASMFKMNNSYRFQIILKYKNYEDIKSVLIDLDNIYKNNNKVNIEIDNNPSRI